MFHDLFTITEVREVGGFSWKGVLPGLCQKALLCVFGRVTKEHCLASLAMVRETRRFSKSSGPTWPKFCLTDWSRSWSNTQCLPHVSSNSTFVFSDFSPTRSGFSFFFREEGCLSFLFIPRTFHITILMGVWEVFLSLLRFSFMLLVLTFGSFRVRGAHTFAFVLLLWVSALTLAHVWLA